MDRIQKLLLYGISENEKGNKEIYIHVDIINRNIECSVNLCTVIKSYRRAYICNGFICFFELNTKGEMTYIYSIYTSSSYIALVTWM